MLVGTSRLLAQTSACECAHAQAKADIAYLQDGRTGVPPELIASQHTISFSHALCHASKHKYMLQASVHC